MTELIIKNGLVVDPTQNLNAQMDIAIKNGKIVDINTDIQNENAEIISADGKWVFPGLIDMHVHLREPGFEYKETIQTGADAAAAGGFTTIACMPNTMPINDCQSVTLFILQKAAETPLDILPIASITKGMKGKELTEMMELAQIGVIGFSDDGYSVENPVVLRRALEYSKMTNRIIIEHSEDLRLSKDGAMHEGWISSRLGLPGIPSLAEDLIIARNIQLAEYTHARIHIAHVSSKNSVEYIRNAKARGIQVTAEVTPHHLFLTDEAVTTFDTNTKMNPPLRSEDDRNALIEGLMDGTIDCIATDHAPHATHEKEVEYIHAPNGVVGLETSLALVLTKFIHTRKMDLNKLVEVMSSNPAKILGINKGHLQKNADADLTIIDPEHYWIVDPSTFKSKSSNSPFIGWNLRGAAEITIKKGKVIYRLTEE